MARAYSDDLRCKFLAAYEGGDGSLRELSARFGVSLPYAKKIRQHLLRSGKMERVPQPRYGPVSRVTAAAETLLRDQVRATPDATLAELRQVLHDQLQIAVNPIQKAWSKIKQLLRSAKARLLDALEQAAALAFAAITAENAAAWFAHCGYGI
jgi:transposase